jgi:hypothetical protein
VARPQRAPGKRRLYPSVHPVLVLGGAPPVVRVTEASGAVAEPNGAVASDQGHAEHELESKDDESPPRNLGRLTDPALYTGAHKHRFDADGRGRGLEGRDSMPKGAGATPASHAPRTAFKGHTNTGSDEKIDSIAQILRSK